MAASSQHNFIPALPFCHVSLKGERPLPKAYPRELKTLGDHLRKKRLDLKLLQKEVAQVLGVTKDTVTYWEVGRSSPDLHGTAKIIKFLGYIPSVLSDKEPKTLGKKIVYYRRLAGITQKELARRLGVDTTTLAKWERGEREPRSIFQERLSNLLNFFSYNT